MNLALLFFIVPQKYHNLSSSSLCRPVWRPSSMERGERWDILCFVFPESKIALKKMCELGVLPHPGRNYLLGIPSVSVCVFSPNIHYFWPVLGKGNNCIPALFCLSFLLWRHSPWAAVGPGVGSAAPTTSSSSALQHDHGTEGLRCQNPPSKSEEGKAKVRWREKLKQVWRAPVESSAVHSRSWPLFSGEGDRCSAGTAGPSVPTKPSRAGPGLSRSLHSVPLSQAFTRPLLDGCSPQSSSLLEMPVPQTCANPGLLPIEWVPGFAFTSVV